MIKPVPVSKLEGKSSRQAHADLPDNTFERELGHNGFYGNATQMYHSHPPTAWESIDGPLKPRAFDTCKLENINTDPFAATVLMSNDKLSIRHWQTRQSMVDLARNSDGDELLFVHKGAGEFFCDYGHLSITEGDYLLIPRGTMWRVETTEMQVLLIEATNNHYGLPDKGLLGHHAIFDPAMFDSPRIDEQFEQQKGEEQTSVIVKRNQQFSTINYAFNPLDAVGWHGNLMPVKINCRDIRPVMSHRYHLPPSVHTTFVSEHFVVCTFCPRPLETDPDALKVPFFHNNDDYDEVIFYHQGDFFSRDNIHPGMLTLHPSGITHGPHPNAFATGKKASRKETNEVAVMIDSRDALEIADLPDGVEWMDYVYSWKQENNSSNTGD